MRLRRSDKPLPDARMLLDLAQRAPKPFDVLVVEDLSRLARNGRTRSGSGTR